ncbi:MAG: EAL domain-containing protein [Actinomycetota bacterium]
MDIRATVQRSSLEVGEDLERLLALTIAISEARDFSSSLKIVLEAMCEITGWGYGQAWVPSGEGDYLTLSPAWHSTVERSHAQRRTFERIGFRSSESLPGSVFTSREPLRIIDVARDPRVAVTDDAHVTGFVSAMYVPVVHGEDCLAILEFLAPKARETDAALLADMMQMGTRLAYGLSRKHAIQANFEVEENFRDLVEGVVDYAILMLDVNGVVISWNAGAQRIQGYEASEVIGKEFSIFYPEESSHREPERDLKMAADNGRLEVEGWRVRKDGSRFLASVLLTPMYDGVGEIKGFSKVVRDITERRLAEAKLHHLALHDPLTGLPNRTLFMDRLEQALARIQRSSTWAAVLFMDIDHFKSINDTFGHEAGDQVLKAVAARLRVVMRPRDTVARFGGDEFVFLCEDLSGIAEITSIAERLASQVCGPLEIEGRDVDISVSIGIAMSDRSEESTLVVLQNADSAMYQAKQAGRARFEFFDDEMRKVQSGRVETEQQLRRAIEQREFCLEFQPLVRLTDSSTVGFEAFLRWNHPTRGMLGSDEFIALAEETGLIRHISSWVLDRSCAWLASQDSADTFVSVNLSACEVVQPELPKLVRATLTRHGIDAGRLVIEIKEKAAMQYYDAALRTLSQLRDLGVKVSLDDFGLGFSSLAHLQSLPLDMVKIAGPLVSDLDTAEANAAVTSAVIDLAHSIGLQVVAECVETKTQADVLKKIGCDLAQGLWFGTPACE